MDFFVGGMRYSMDPIGTLMEYPMESNEINPFPMGRFLDPVRSPVGTTMCPMGSSFEGRSSDGKLHENFHETYKFKFPWEVPWEVESLGSPMVCPMGGRVPWR